MNYQSLKSIPELRDAAPKERNKLVKVAYERDRSLSALNMLHAMAAFFSVLISINLTEAILGYRSPFWIVTMFLLFIGIASFVLTRFLIYPRIASALRGIQTADSPDHEED